MTDGWADRQIESDAYISTGGLNEATDRDLLGRITSHHGKWEMFCSDICACGSIHHNKRTGQRDCPWWNAETAWMLPWEFFILMYIWIVDWVLLLTCTLDDTGAFRDFGWFPALLGSASLIITCSWLAVLVRWPAPPPNENITVASWTVSLDTCITCPKCKLVSTDKM